MANWTLRSAPLRAAGERLVGLAPRAALPAFAGRTFQRWAKQHASPPAARRVAYFHGCGANWYEPGPGEMTVELLEHIGCQVEVPRGQACCGLPAQSNGMFDLARTLRAPDGAAARAGGARRASTSSARRRAAR